MSDGALYDRIGVGYARYRQPDPTIAAMIADAIGDARSVVSVGAGTGSYEPVDRAVVAIEPSSVMVRQRPRSAAPCIAAVAEALPLASRSFDVALAIMTIHHWSDVAAGLAEMQRVARRQVVLTFDPVAHASHWLVDYVPEMAAHFSRTPAVDAVADAIGARAVRVVPVRHDTPDGMTVAYWRRPEAYLDADRQAAGSAFQQVDPVALARGIERLATDLASGAWHARYRDLLAAETMDYGLRLIVS